MKIWCVAAFVAAVALPGVVFSQRACSGGKVYRDCGSACPATCRNPSPFCTFQCVSGCFCPQGMVDNEGTCVSPSQCPTCSGGKVLVACMNTCPVTCDNPSPPVCTSFVCISGCECPSGMALHNNMCIMPSQCPATTPAAATVQPTPPVCTSGMAFNHCGTACPLTCEFPDPRPCTRNCVSGCFCPTGLLENNGMCVERNQCPNAATTVAPPPTEPVCTNGRIHTTCGTSCPLTCQNFRNPPFACTLNCVVGCFCPAGLVQNGDRCVTSDQCPGEATAPPTNPPATRPPPVTTLPPSCTSGQVYMTCGTRCPQTCENINGPVLACTEECVAGCFCPTGMVRNGEQCVTADQCPKATTSVEEVPTTPTCQAGMVYKTCGPICRQTCSPSNLCFSLRCAAGCFCPDGMFEHEGGCIAECPTAVASLEPTTGPVCTNGFVPSNCATACPLTCQSLYAPPRPCPLFCRQGCVCPSGMAEDGDRCVPTSQCHNPCDTVRCASQCVVDNSGNAMCVPDCAVNNGNCSPNHICTRNNYTCTTGSFCDLNRFVNCATSPVTVATPGVVTRHPTQPTRPTVCPSGMAYNDCGTRCPLTCEFPDPRPCVRICQRGCFCPTGLLESNGECVERRRCPTHPCASMTCPGSNRCVVSNVTGEAKCVVSCGVNNGGCSSDRSCEVRTLGCGPSSTQPCDSTFFRMCKVVPFVVCGQDAFLACDSEWTYCLQQNETRRANCVASCLSLNGNCKDDTVCVTNITTGSPRLSCLEQKELPKDCPAGQVMNQCGNACQETCESHLKGPLICPEVCGPPACVCPRGLVLFRDRCVDPRLCYVLIKYPTAISPLPLVNGKSVLLSVVTSDLTQEAFDAVQSNFLMSVQNTLNAMTNYQVQARLHGVYPDTSSSTPTLTIVVEVSGSTVSRQNAQSFADILNQNSHLLVIEIDSVEPQKVVYVDEADQSSQGLTNNAIIGIAVGSAVVGLCFVTIWIALVACCCMFNRRMSTKASRDPSPSPSEKPFIFSEIGPQENDYVVKPLDNKGKLIKESLMY